MERRTLQLIIAPVRWVLGIAIAVFVVVHVASLLLINLDKVLPDDALVQRSNFRETPELNDDLLTPARYYASATRTEQRWNMFSPNVGKRFSVPVVMLELKHAKYEYLHSPVEGDLIQHVNLARDIRKIPESQRQYEWKFHMGDGRLRKMESKFTRPKHFHIERTVYTRWRINQWLEANPEKRDQLLRVHLLRVTVRYDLDDDAPVLDSVTRLQLWTWHDPHWPFQRTLPNMPPIPMPPRGP